MWDMTRPYINIYIYIYNIYIYIYVYIYICTYVYRTWLVPTCALAQSCTYFWFHIPILFQVLRRGAIGVSIGRGEGKIVYMCIYNIYIYIYTYIYICIYIFMHLWEEGRARLYCFNLPCNQLWQGKFVILFLYQKTIIFGFQTHILCTAQASTVFVLTQQMYGSRWTYFPHSSLENIYIYVYVYMYICI